MLSYTNPMIALPLATGVNIIGSDVNVYSITNGYSERITKNNNPTQLSRRIYTLDKTTKKVC